MKIEKPDWNDFIKTGFLLNKDQKEGLDFWFQENVDPVNKMIKASIQTFGYYYPEGDMEGKKWVYWNGDTHLTPTHKALLINIQEIKPRTKGERAIELLKDLILELDGYNLERFVKRAKQILEGSDG